MLLRAEFYDFVEDFTLDILVDVIQTSTAVYCIEESEIRESMYTLRKKDAWQIIQELEAVYRTYMEKSYYTNVDIQIFKEIHTLQRIAQAVSIDRIFQDEDIVVVFKINKRETPRWKTDSMMREVW